jgi:hypothetical protein
LAQTIAGSTLCEAAKLAKPQSVPAITFLAPDEPRVPDDPLGHELGVRDVVRRRVEHAGDQQLALGQRHVLEDGPLVEAVEALGDVGRVGDLARLAVVDDRDPGAS